jgi:hypothetical protein
LAGRVLLKVVYVLTCPIPGLVVVLPRGDRATAAKVLGQTLWPPTAIVALDSLTGNPDSDRRQSASPATGQYCRPLPAPATNPRRVPN